MDIVRKISVWLGDFVFGLLVPFSPSVILWILSAAMGLVMLLIWRYTSNQAAIADVRRKVQKLTNRFPLYSWKLEQTPAVR